MKVSERNVLDRRSFIKGLLAVGATATVAACTPIATAPTPGAAVPGATVVGPSWIHPKSLVRATQGPGGNLAWKAGDAVKWLPPEKIPAGAAADLLASLPKAKLADIYRKMYMDRRFEDQLRDNILGGKDGLYQYWCSNQGEEASSVASIAALEPNDLITSTHRPGGHVIAKGLDLKKLAAEHYMRATGQSAAYGNRMHMAEPSIGLLGTSGLVGSGNIIGAGAAWNVKARGTGQVVMTFLGDNATPSIFFFSALRMSTLYKLPFVVVVENNFYAIGLPVGCAHPTAWIADLPVGLGIPSVVVDGNDVAAVYAASKEAVDRARAGEGPSVIEALTYRWYDHGIGAGARVGVDGAWGLPYRTDDELRGWMGRDPIKRFGTFLVERGLFTDAELKGIEAEVQKVVLEAYDFARASPLPKPEDGVKGVWSLGPVPVTQF